MRFWNLYRKNSLILEWKMADELDIIEIII